MNRKLLILSTLLLYIILFLSGINGARALPIEKEGLSIYSQALKKEVSYSMVLPEDYDYSDTEYPVLYMFHGIGGDNSSWLEYGNVARVMDKMIKDGEIQPFIMVIPNGYLSYYSDTYDGSFLYETFFIKELIPYIDSNYRTRKNVAARSVIGFSMGGFGALSISLRNRNLFGSVIALSPSIRTEKQYIEEGPQKEWDSQWGRIFGGIGKNGNQRLTSYYKQHSPYYIFSTLRNSDLKGFGIMLDIGDKEGSLCESNEELHRLLLEKEIPHEWEVRSGGHDFTCWNAALPKAFRFVNGYFNESRQGNDRKKALDETPVIKLSDAMVYYPEQAKESTRKYPVIYIQGEIGEPQQKTLVSQFHQMVNDNKTWPAVLCFVKANENLSESISGIEKHLPGIRDTQRMRTLITLGDCIKEGIKAIRKENLFTGIVCVNAAANESDAQDFIKAVGSHERYPRCWIEVLPELKEYGFSSNAHILLKESDLEHEFRAKKCKENNAFSYWEEWIIYLNNRIHV